MNSEFSFYYTTWPDVETATRASQILLEEKLVACTNLIPGMQSQYWWQGQIESSQECVMILKSRTDFREKLQKRFQSLHPYEVPCFVQISLDDGLPKYLSWLGEALK